MREDNYNFFTHFFILYMLFCPALRQYVTQIEFCYKTGLNDQGIERHLVVFHPIPIIFLNGLDI